MFYVTIKILRDWINLYKLIQSFLIIGLSESEDEGEKSVITKKRKVTFNLDKNPLITDLDHRDKKTKRALKAELWFEKDSFKNLIDEKDEDYELDKMIEDLKRKGGRLINDENSGKSESKKPKKKNQTVNDEDSDYDMEEMMAQNKKVKKIGGKDGYEVLAKGTRKLNF